MLYTTSLLRVFSEALAKQDMGITLTGPDSLISNTATILNRVRREFEHSEEHDYPTAELETCENSIKRVVHETSVYLGRLGNAHRLMNITLVNYGIFTIFGYLLVRLSTRYHKLYTRSSILATIATNIVLYGISDTCAQSIAQFLEGRSYRLGDGSSRVFSSQDGIGQVRITLHNDNDTDDDDNDIRGGDGDPGPELFVDYGETDNEQELPTGGYTVDIENGRGGHSIDRPATGPAVQTKFNFRRFFGFLTWGFIMAFIQVVWYMFLNAMFTDMPSIVSVLERDLTDQLLFSPISLACFFAYTTIIIEGGDKQTYKDKMLKLYLTTLAVSFSVWFPVQFINFLVMPKKFQVPFSSSVGVVWNCFLSYRNASATRSNCT